MIKGISGREDSFLIGFIDEAYGREAITLNEMKLWIYTLLEKHDDLPSYLFDLLDVKSPRDFDEIITFPTCSETTEKERLALFGIAWKRGNLAPDAELNISKKSALRALEESPELEKRFRETFPFIKW